jgi:nicotinamide riboside transporter PnuC
MENLHRIVAVLILIFGPIVAVLLYPFVNLQVEYYAIVVMFVILIFSIWAWKEYPPFTYIPGS